MWPFWVHFRSSMQYYVPTRHYLLFFLLTAIVSCTALAGPSTLEMFSPQQYVTTAAQSMYFPVSRSGDAGYDVVLNYQTADASAIAGIDYLAVTNFLTLPENSLGAFLP